MSKDVSGTSAPLAIVVVDAVLSLSGGQKPRDAGLETASTIISGLDELFGGNVYTQRVPNTVEDIRSAVQNLAGEHALIVVTGGTCLGPGDKTYESISSLLSHEIPAMRAALLLARLSQTPEHGFARATAGVRDNSLIVTVPGPAEPAKVCINAITPIIPDTLRLVGNWKVGGNAPNTNAVNDSDPNAGVNAVAELSDKKTAESREELRTQTAKLVEHLTIIDASDSLEKTEPSITGTETKNQTSELKHSRSHSEPQYYGRTSRMRSDAYPTVSFESALASVLEHSPEPRTTTVSLDESIGHVLCEDLFSPLNVPPFRASIVDGYAVAHSDCPGDLPVSKVLVASSDLALFKRSTCMRITTGAPVPHGATAVVPLENTVVVAETEDHRELVIRIDATDVKSGDNIRKIGSDLALGSLILPKGTLISAIGGEVGTLASTGLFCAPVFAKPIVGVISTGDELVSVDSPCYGSQIWDSNRPMLLTSLRYRHINCVDFGIACDNRDILIQRLTAALEQVDILVTTGGVSVGELDLLKPCIIEMGGTIHFGNVAMKPGRPVTFATIGKKCIFALPGNPASAAVCLNLFVLPCIDKMSGADPSAVRIKVRINTNIKLDARPEFHRASVKASDDGWIATSTGYQRSSRVKSMAGANALLCLPPSTATQDELKAGSIVDAILLF